MRAAPIVLCLAALLLALLAPFVQAGTTTTTVQATILNTQDSYVVQDNVTEKDGSKPELRIKASGGTKNRNLLANINLPSLTGKTVLQANLKLVMFGASSSTPMYARVYPLTQTWNELDVSWRDRTTLSPWTTPGGTAGPYWTDALLLSDEQNGSRVSWQVGPIVNAWLLGDLTNCGFVIKPDAGGSDRELVFRSSEYTNVTTDTPQLTIVYTDEPPALRNGYAEIQPTAVRAGATNTPLTLWLDVNSSGSTPSGTATGFDLVSVLHEGAIAVTGIDRVLVGGVAIDPSQITGYDNG
ncbi:MAG TPA: DNRLRE domain-containing protein, partial [Candidatus Polarisedimenticolia bacterium]|nr:DNRLRE domain-containing protein [Candidatus Polarisedimenticolia bacterium]